VAFYDFLEILVYNPLDFLFHRFRSNPLHRMGDFLRLLRITSKALGEYMVVMSCDDMNKFLYVCVAFASRIHKFNICNVNASCYKWFLWLASQDLEKFRFIGGTPRKGQLVMGVVAAHMSVSTVGRYWDSSPVEFDCKTSI
jgi:hypothetical protein